MEPRDIIIQELNGLESRLAAMPARNVYDVPAGYFDALPGQVMSRIRALEATDSREELAILSPLLAGLQQTNPYQVPNGYFDTLEKGWPAIMQDADLAATEELEHLSPLLSGLKKQMPYSIPAGYFDSLQVPSTGTQGVPAGARVVTMPLRSRRWLRYTAAAAIVIFVALGSFFYLNGKKTTDAGESYAWVKENMNGVSTDALDEFVATAEKEIPVAVTAAAETNEVRELMKNISDTEIQDFLNETEAIAAETDEDILLN
ncbi:MAG: hypothetical protein ABW019_13630 [Chitinophagaceae bacterium]